MSASSLVRAILVSLVLLPAYALAQTSPPAPTDTVPDPELPSGPALCPLPADYRLDGESDVKIGTSQEYRVGWPLSGSGNAVVTYSLRRP